MMELLAPAGNLNTALAAFDAGADAVYAGLQRFNARERGDNFSAGEMARLVNFAHRNGKKVYVTFNTLVYQSELPAAADALAELSVIRPDALIVQDPGIVRMIREYFPELRIHGSTQMAVHNSAGIRTAAAMGISRVILERQVTLDELREIMRNSPLEVEVFVHGALCCSLSGICLLSSFLDGSSGNRGKCRQPCRRLFCDDSGREGFFLSPRDLYGISLIPEFMKMGIASVKIEGRLRKADYVSTVVSAYRKVMDSPGSEKARSEAMEILSRACSRERSLGFYTEKSAETLIRADAPGGTGKILGRSLRILRDSFEAELVSSLHVGDNIRVQTASGGDASAFTVLDLRDRAGKNLLKAAAGSVCVIGCRGKNIPPDGILYKIGETHDTMEKRMENLPPFRPELPVKIRLQHDFLRAEVLGQVFEMPLELAPASRHALTEDSLQESFCTIGEMPFTVARADVSLEPGLFVPASVLKEIRRRFREWAVEHISAETDRANASACAERVKQHLTAGKEKRSLDFTVPDFNDPESVMVLPYFTAEPELPELRRAVERAVQRGVRTFAASSLSHFTVLKDFRNIHIVTYPPFPVANSSGAEETASLGAGLVHAHLELPPEEMALLAEASPVPVGVFETVSPVLLATRAAVSAKGGLTDRNGHRLILMHRNGFTEVRPENPVTLPHVPGTVPLTDSSVPQNTQNTQKNNR